MLHIIPHIKKEAAMTRSDRSIIEIPGSPQEGEYQIGGGSSYMTPQPPVESFFEHSFNQGETIQSPSHEKDEEYLRKNITRFPELGERRFGGIEAVGERLQGTGMSGHGETREQSHATREAMGDKPRKRRKRNRDTGAQPIARSKSLEYRNIKERHLDKRILPSQDLIQEYCDRHQEDLPKRLQTQYNSVVAWLNQQGEKESQRFKEYTSTFVRPEEFSQDITQSETISPGSRKRANTGNGRPYQKLQRISIKGNPAQTAQQIEPEIEPEAEPEVICQHSESPSPDWEIRKFGAIRARMEQAVESAFGEHVSDRQWKKMHNWMDRELRRQYKYQPPSVQSEEPEAPTSSLKSWDRFLLERLKLGEVVPVPDIQMKEYLPRESRRLICFPKDQEHHRHPLFQRSHPTVQYPNTTLSRQTGTHNSTPLGKH